MPNIFIFVVATLLRIRPKVQAGAILVALCLSCAVHAELAYRVENIGNDLLSPDGKKHGQEQITGLAVTPYGRCFAAAVGNEMHREGTIYEDGDIVGGDYGPKGVTGVLRRGGKSSRSRDVACDANYAYIWCAGWQEKEQEGLLVFHHNGAYANMAFNLDEGSPAIGNGAPLSIAVSDDYLAVVVNDWIKLYNKSTRTFWRSFSVPGAGAMEFDASGNLWIAANMEWDYDVWSSNPGNPPQIRCYTPTGTLVKTINGPASDWLPTALAFDNQGRLMVADDGPGAHIIRFYDVSGTPTQEKTFGTIGGIGAGTPGEITAFKFMGITGCGVDSDGNIYMTWHQTRAAGIRAFEPSGNLLWKVECWTWTTCPDFDRTKDGTELYSARAHLVWNPKTGDWEAEHYTMDLDAHPDDPRENWHDQCGVHVRYKEGKRFLFCSNMKNNNNLTIYKFNGWVAEKSAVLDIDRPDWYVDESCNIWHASSLSVTRKPCTGVNASGDLTWGATETCSIPDNPFNELGKIHYIDAVDAMIIAGGTPSDPLEGSCHAGPVVSCYENWSTAPVLAWQTTVSFYNPPGVPVHKTIRPNCMSATEDYVVIGYARDDGVEPPGTDQSGTLHVLDRTDGSFAGRIFGQEHLSSWIDMLRTGVHAYKRTNGSTLIAREANYRGNTPIYILAGGLPGDMDGDGRVDLKDLGILAGNWMNCIDPRNPGGIIPCEN